MKIKEKEYALPLSKIIEFSLEMSYVPSRIKQLNKTHALLPKFIDYYNKSIFKRLWIDEIDLCSSLLYSVDNYAELVKTREGIGDDLFNDLAETLLKSDPVVAIDYRIPPSLFEMHPFIKTSLDIDELYNSIKTQVSDAYKHNFAFRCYFIRKAKYFSGWYDNGSSFMDLVDENK